MSGEIENESLNAALAVAWDEAESGDESTEIQGGDTGQGWDESEKGASDSAELAPEGGTEGGSAESGEADPTAVQPDGESADGHGQAAEAAEQSAIDKPPVGLPPEAREAWKDTPTAMKEAIAKREKDFAYQIQKTAEGAKRAEAMDRSLQPFQQLFQMNGGASQFLPNMLQVASLLQMGTPQQKAQTAANLIKQFGVDVQTLDNALVGEQPPPEVQQQSQLDQLLNQRLAPLQQQLSQYQQREQYAQQQAQHSIQTELSEFAAQNEFYEDLKGDMADLMELASNRGREMSLEQAYSIASKQHPTISKILESRIGQETVNRKRSAASSVSGSPGGTMEAPPANSIAAALNDAWENAGRV